MQHRLRALGLTCVLATTALAAGATPSWAQRALDASEVCERSAAGRAPASTEKVRSGSGISVTEYRERGSYRVVDCSADGDLVNAVTAEPHRLPDGSVTWLPHEVERSGAKGAVATIAEFGDFRLYDGDWRAAVRELRELVPEPASPSRLSAHAVPPLSNDPAVLRQQREIAAGTSPGIRFARGERPPESPRQLQDFRCSTGDYVYSYRYKNSAAHYINLAPIGQPYHADFIQNINEGFNAWQHTYNICGFAPVNGVTAATVGYTQIPAATGDGGAGINDGIEVVDAGLLNNPSSPCNAALACAYSQPDGRHDVRMSQSYPWCVGWCAGYYDIWSVLAHEAGHVYGFNHAANNDMVMGPYISAGEAHKRYLWNGDYRGLLDVY